MAQMSVNHASIFYNLGEKRALLDSVLFNGLAAVRSAIAEKFAPSHANLSEKTEPVLGVANATSTPIGSPKVEPIYLAEAANERATDNVVSDTSNAEPTQLNAVQPIDSAGGVELLEAIADLGLSVKRQGSWLWVFTHDENFSAPLKALGFLWSHKRRAWYFTLKSARSASNPAVAEALTVIKHLGLTAEVRADWVWVFGAQASHETALRAAGFKWSYKRGSWYLNPPVQQSLPSQPGSRGTAWDYYRGHQTTAL